MLREIECGEQKHVWRVSPAGGRMTLSDEKVGNETFKILILVVYYINITSKSKN